MNTNMNINMYQITKLPIYFSIFFELLDLVLQFSARIIFIYNKKENNFPDLNVIIISTKRWVRQSASEKHHYCRARVSLRDLWVKFVLPFIQVPANLQGMHL